MNGIILDFELASANEYDLEVGFELLSEHTDLQVSGDKAYISAAKPLNYGRRTALSSKLFHAAINKNNCIVLCNASSTLFAR